LISLLSNLGLGAIIGGMAVYLSLKFLTPHFLLGKSKKLVDHNDFLEVTDTLAFLQSDSATIINEMKKNHKLICDKLADKNDTAEKVYIDAVEAIIRSQNMIFNFSNLNMLEQDITSCLRKATSSFMASMAAETLRLTFERRELMTRKSNIQRIEHLRICSKQEIDRYIALMQNLNLEGNSDPRLWEAINSGVKYEQEKVSKYNVELENLWALQNVEHIKLTKCCMNIFFKISDLLPATIVSIRKELGINLDNYMEIFNENIKKTQQVCSDFLKKSEENI